MRNIVFLALMTPFAIAFGIIMIGPILFILALFAWQAAVQEYRRKVEEGEALKEAEAEIMASVREQEDEPVWDVFRDPDMPQVLVEFDGHPEFGVIVKDIEGNWTPVGADMPRLLPPRRSEAHG